MKATRLATIFAALLALATPGWTQEPDRDGDAAPVETAEVTLRWTARQEKSIYGYLVYRSDRRAGPFLRINERIVRAIDSASEATENEYVFVDRGARAGQRYYYYLDTVSRTGRKQRFSGVLSKVAEGESETREGAGRD